MKPPDRPMTLPLEYAAQIAFELNSMRRECGQLANNIMSRTPLNERGLEECARLDGALSHAHGVLADAVGEIRSSQPKRISPEK